MHEGMNSSAAHGLDGLHGRLACLIGHATERRLRDGGDSAGDGVLAARVDEPQRVQTLERVLLHVDVYAGAEAHLHVGRVRG